MKPFKYWIYFFVICFSLGFLNGIFIEPSEKQMTILSLKKEILTPDLINFFKQVYNINIVFIFAENKNDVEGYLVKKGAPDLVLAPSNVLDYFSQQGLLSSSKKIEKHNQNQSPALMVNTNSLNQVPIAWNLTEKENKYALEILSLSIPVNAESVSNSESELDLFIEALKKTKGFSPPYRFSFLEKGQKNQELEEFVRSHEINKIILE
ncbi:MAG TPA: hypothetical protein PLJ21_08290 [Pseudobdellovibrionaceae bacterium]|nr:hypothetical protein [Pseudobdellovibrionaceae bacterium]